jgi:Uncharacterized protein conserved in bacteria (DUF2334)
MTIDRLIGPNGNVPILIRDDDTNFFTTESMIKTVYSKAWENGFKVSLSVIPLQKCMNDLLVPPDMRKSTATYPVSANEQLIRFLKGKIENNSVEILQHGFSHAATNRNRGEFAGDSLNNKLKLEYGKNILRKSFKVEPRFFVPPGDDISNKSLQFVSDLAMIPIYRKSYFDEFLRSEYIPAFTKYIALKIITRRYKTPSNSNFGLSLVKPVWIHANNIGISWSLPSGEYVKLTSLESLLDLTSRLAQSCRSLRRPVCILNHYHIYFYDWKSSISNLELFRAWHKILESFANLPFGWKATFSDLYDRVRKIQQIKIVKQGSKITIQSDESIKGFAFRTGGRIKPKTNILVDKETNITTIEDLSPDSTIILYEN